MAAMTAVGGRSLQPRRGLGGRPSCAWSIVGWDRVRPSVTAGPAQAPVGVSWGSSPTWCGCCPR